MSRHIGKELISAAPAEYAIGNIVRRILNLIREEHVQKQRYFLAHHLFHSEP
jgi:hypothetical protein